MKKNLTISLNLKEDYEIRKFINEMILAQVKSISRDLIANEVRKHMDKVIEEAIDKQSSILKYKIAELYDKERVSRYNELKDEIVTSARRITNEVLVNAKDSINKALDNVHIIHKRLKICDPLSVYSVYILIRLFVEVSNYAVHIEIISCCFHTF